MIPSTSDGQAKDASSLIDADELVISDMGDMGNMGGPGRMQGFPPGFEDSPGDDTPEFTPSVSDKTGRKAPPS